MKGIITGAELAKGERVETRKNHLSITQPLQFLTRDKKDEDWCRWNLDWLEWNGIKQIRHNAIRMMKNYHLAEGIIDEGDYIRNESNDYQNLVNELYDKQEPIEIEKLKYYPIIPNVINTLCSEFAKRDCSIMYRAVDEYSKNELLTSKYEDLKSSLLAKAEADFLTKAIEEGIDFSSEEDKKRIQEGLSQAQSLQQINDFYSKTYQSICEYWASKQASIDEERFRMKELEMKAWKDRIIVNREFWHFPMFEDDYKIEIWNPMTTFYQKSPEEEYISNANYVGHIELLTPSDIIDKYGWRMTEKQLESMQERWFSAMPLYADAGQTNDGSMYDLSRSHEWNVKGPSFQYRNAMNVIDAQGTNDVIDEILRGKYENDMFNNDSYLRVTTSYWKTHVRIGHLTKISKNGEVTTEIVTEQYRITDEPIYNTTFFKEKTKQNLLFGEHIDWFWINEVWGGIKIGANIPPHSVMGEDETGFDPIYLGINNPEIGPLQFQLKGDDSLYGCKLPVEGKIYTNRGQASASVVDKMKPQQIAFNIVNNQILDILLDEIGPVLLLDQNSLLNHSAGEDWDNSLAKTYVAMKDFSIIPIDKSTQNGGNNNFNQYQVMDLSQTNRFRSRIDLANYFKGEAFSQIGVSTQRMGAPIGKTSSATEAEQVEVGSYEQTEMLFVEHCDYLMPRVHKMRTDLAQWYLSNKASVSLQVNLGDDERMNFELNGTDLLLRDINVFCSTDSHTINVLKQLKQLAVQNNTMGASIYDLGRVLQADTLGSLNAILKEAERKRQEQIQDSMIQEQKLQKEKEEAELREKQIQYDFEAQEKEKDRRKDILVAEIKASGYGAMQDINQNQQSDFLDSLNNIKKTQAYIQQTSDNTRKVNSKIQNDREKLDLKREEIAMRKEIADKQLTIARENKNQFDYSAKGLKKAKPEKKEKK